ncbi:hypothetical protein C8Q76DRAFT_798224 [Earliella scabrosa]|nr:hypothetical protein C8Q76DRAFT_798224 [Earliella scabrosa]
MDSDDDEYSSHGGDTLDSSRSSHLQLGKHVRMNVTALVQRPDHCWKTSLDMLPRDETGFRSSAGIATRVPPRGQQPRTTREISFYSSYTTTFGLTPPRRALLQNVLSLVRSYSSLHGRTRRRSFTQSTSRCCGSDGGRKACRGDEEDRVLSTG